MTVTRLLGELQGGNRAVADELVGLIYEELHSLAHNQRRGWHGDYTVNTTALVHEAYLKLVDQSQPAWESRAHFLAVAAKAMRH
ncbi:ECF-type sigma factor, partial [Escherichia coli]